MTHDPIGFIGDFFILLEAWTGFAKDIGQKLLQIIGLHASSSLFPMSRLLQNSTGIKISYCSGYRGSIAYLRISGYQDTLEASIGMSGPLSGMKLWGIIFLSSEQLSEYISHLFRKRTHI